MNTAAEEVMKEFRDIRIAYGQSDEFNFVFDKESKIYGTFTNDFTMFVKDAVVLKWFRLWCHALREITFDSGKPILET